MPLSAGLGAVAALGAGVFAAPLADFSEGGPGGFELDTYADDVAIDTNTRELALHGHVEVGAAPFHLRADALRLRRTPRGVAVEGEGTLAFCPCLGTPLTLSFHDALVAPPSDLILRSPRLEIYGVPVAWLPYVWLRAPDRPGLLPPTLAYRGGDGVFLGSGVHLPWTRSDREHGLDLSLGGYFVGGAAVAADLRTERTRTVARFDALRARGLSVDARGSQGDRIGAAWDVTTMRGARALAATIPLDEAALPLDRARGEATLRDGPVTLSSAVLAVAPRGSEGVTGLVGGPMARVFAGGALSRHTTADGSVEGGGAGAGGENAISWSAASLGAHAHHAAGPIGLSGDARGDAAVIGGGDLGARGVVARGALRAGLPLARAFPSADPSDPWRHRLEPHAGVAYSGGAVSASLPYAYEPTASAAVMFPRFVAASPPDGASGYRQVIVPELGVASALGRFAARDGVEADLRAGVALGDAGGTVARARVAATGDLFGASLEGGAQLAWADRTRGASSEGVAGTARARLGHVDGLRLEGHVGGRSAIDPVLARLLGPERTPPLAMFAAPGASVGAGVVAPLGARVTARGGADVDLSTGLLVGTRGSVALRDACGCVTLQLFGSERLGRDGVDVWLALDLGDPSARHP